MTRFAIVTIVATVVISIVIFIARDRLCVYDSFIITIII